MSAKSYEVGDQNQNYSDAYHGSSNYNGESSERRQENRRRNYDDYDNIPSTNRSDYNDSNNRKDYSEDSRYNPDYERRPNVTQEYPNPVHEQVDTPNPPTPSVYNNQPIIRQEEPIYYDQRPVPPQQPPYNPHIDSPEYPVRYDEGPPPPPPIQNQPYDPPSQQQQPYNSQIDSPDYPVRYDERPGPIQNQPYDPPPPQQPPYKPVPVPNYIINDQPGPIEPNQSKQPHKPVVINYPKQPTKPIQRESSQHRQNPTPKPIVMNNIPPPTLNNPPAVLKNPDLPTGNMLPDDDDPASIKYRTPNFPPPDIQYGRLPWSERTEIPPPPITLNQTPASVPKLSPISKEVTLSKEECREAFIEFADSSCCYGKRPAQEAKIIKIIPTTALLYSLETFTQKRFITYKFRAYGGGPIDTNSNGPIPMVWDVPVSPREQFKTSNQKLTIPHSEQIINCFRCGAQGNLRCSGCSGRGGKICSLCQGYRYIRNASGYDTCNSCLGQGIINCNKCFGKGYKTCTICSGSKRLICYLELEVVFINHKDHFIIEKTDLPDELVEAVTGEPLLRQTNRVVLPITNCPFPDITVNSQRIHSEHRRFLSTEYPILQRQNLDSILVVEVHYIWNEIQSRFWVFGYEHSVYSPDYPQSGCGCCCCCACCGSCKCCCKCCQCAIL